MDNAKNWKSWLAGLLGAGVLAAGLAACNTFEGAGKDVSATGNAISDTAKDTKEAITE